MIKLKDLIQENLNEEDSLLSKIGKYIKGTEHIEIIIYSSPATTGSSRFAHEDDVTKVESIAKNISEKILVRKYGMAKSGTDLGDFRSDSQGRVTFYWVELTDSNKQKFSDSNIKRMVDECIRELSKSKLVPGVEITFDATLSKRNKIVKTIYEKSYAAQ